MKFTEYGTAGHLVFLTPWPVTGHIATAYFHTTFAYLWYYQGYILSTKYSMVGCYTFVGPTLLIESENFSIAFFQELNINIQTNVLWPSRMKKNLNHCWIINVYVPKTEFFLFFFSLVWKNFITPSLLSSSVFTSKPSISETRHDRVSRSFHPK